MFESEQPRSRKLVDPAAILGWLYAERWLLLVFFAALTVRLYWNAEVHPPGDYIYSDMNGYVSRADRMLKHGFEPHEYSSFFPFGTHWMVFAIKKTWGAENYVAVGRVYALLGAIAVAGAYAVARRASLFPYIVAPAVGLLGIFYYPHLSLGGYILSEVPYCAFFMLTLVFFMRMLDHGRYADAVAMGLCCALAMCFRPQILLSGAVIGLFWILRRKAVKTKLVHLIVAFVPVIIGLFLCSKLMEHNTGRSGIISENGSFNLVFGRCHNSKIQSMPDGAGHGRVHFRPPPFLQLNNRQRTNEKKRKALGMILDPVLDDTLSYRGYIGDRERHMAFVRECMRKAGWKRQLSYSYTNVSLLWRHNIPWPDSGRKQWKNITRWWTHRHNELIAIPALIGLLFMGFRRTAKMGFVAANIVAMLLLAAIYFGGTRHRATYDFVLIIVAFETYAFAGYALWKGLSKLLRRGEGTAPTPESPEPARSGSDDAS